MTDTVTVDPELAKGLLDEMLDRDAADGPGAEPPPRVPWLNDDGSARWGYKADGSPRKSKPGTGRPPRDGTDKPRTSDTPPPPPPSSGSGATEAKDYTEDIGGALTMVWMGMSSVPWTRAHAGVLRAQTPVMVPAWNTAAQQNKTVRKYVERLSGEGSWGWVLPVTLVTMPLVLGMWQVTVNASLRATLGEQNDQAFAAFMREQARAAGMDVPEPETTPPSASQESQEERDPYDDEDATV